MCTLRYCKSQLYNSVSTAGCSAFLITLLYPLMKTYLFVELNYLNKMYLYLSFENILKQVFLFYPRLLKRVSSKTVDFSFHSNLTYSFSFVKTLMFYVYQQRISSLYIGIIEGYRLTRVWISKIVLYSIVFDKSFINLTALLL